MKTKLKILVVSAVLSIIMAKSAFGAAQNANITLPTFDVKLNGIEIDNEYREYPLIVYKGITYIPMTYYDSRFLGLETIWDNISGLKINKNESSQGGYVDNISTYNKSSYKANIIDADVEVNGKIIDNSKEQYPLLLFRDITYFPLTWKFAVDEFGWDYNFTNKEGLNISSKSNILEVSKVNLPVVDRGDFYNNKFIAAGDYFYYEGDKGIIYQAPIVNPSARKAVYELPMWTYGDSYVYPSLDTLKGEAMLFYHQGGASMGTDYRIILNDDGTNKVFSTGYRNKVDFGDVIIDVSHGVPPHRNNLSIKKQGEEEYKPLGNPDYKYGWVNIVGSSPSVDLYKIDNEIYILANIYDDGDKGTTGIHKVNINTGETIRICEESAKQFIIEDNMIYFMDLEGYLYKITVDGNKAEKLTDFTVSNFTVLNNFVYYVTEDDKGLELFKLGDSASVNPAGRVKKLVNSDDGYVYCIFENDSPYKLIVFNKDGAVFKTNSNIRFAWIDNNRLFYQK